MMVTGGTSSKRIPQFSDAAASFDCAAATVLHMAQPWASSSGALANAQRQSRGCQDAPLSLLEVFHRCSRLLTSEPLSMDVIPRRQRQREFKAYQGFICNSRTLSGKNTDQRRCHHNQGWNQRQHQRSFFESQMHEVRHDECGFDERQSHQENEHDRH